MRGEKTGSGSSGSESPGEEGERKAEAVCSAVSEPSSDEIPARAAAEFQDRLDRNSNMLGSAGSYFHSAVTFPRIQIQCCV